MNVTSLNRTVFLTTNNFPPAPPQGGDGFELRSIYYMFIQVLYSMYKISKKLRRHSFLKFGDRMALFLFIFHGL